jgi:hypothetical protein
MAQIRVDATNLSLSEFAIATASSTVITLQSGSVQIIDVAPGPYSFGTLFSPNFAFEVSTDGSLSVDPSVGGFVTANGNTLVVHGLNIKVDATALSLPEFNIGDARWTRPRRGHPVPRLVTSSRGALFAAMACSRVRSRRNSFLRRGRRKWLSILRRARNYSVQTGDGPMQISGTPRSFLNFV